MTSAGSNPKLVSFGAIVAVFLALLFSPRVSVATGAPLWTGKSAGFTITWSTDNLVAKDASGKIVYSAKNAFDKDIGDLVKNDCATVPQGVAEEQLRLLSVTGPILSIEKYTYWDGGGAHPNLISRYADIDLRHPEWPALLTDYFSPNAVARALQGDPIVQQRLAKLAGPSPDKLDALVNALQESDLDTAEAYGFGYGLGQNDLLSRFAFHHLEGDKIAVRIGLSHGAEVNRGTLTQLGVFLPIPPVLKIWLALADGGSEGFLMKQAKADRSLFARTEAGGRSSTGVTTFSVSCVKK